MTPSPLPRDDADASLISLADFRLLLAEQHPFSLLLGIEVERIGRGTALAVLPARDSHQRLGGIVAGPMLMGLADLAMYAAVVLSLIHISISTGESPQAPMHSPSTRVNWPSAVVSR